MPGLEHGQSSDQKTLLQDPRWAGNLAARDFRAVARIPHLHHYGRSRAPTWKNLWLARYIQHLHCERERQRSNERVVEMQRVLDLSTSPEFFDNANHR